MKEFLEKIRNLGGNVLDTAYGFVILAKSVQEASLTVEALEPLCPEGWVVKEASKPYEKDTKQGVYAKSIYINLAPRDKSIDELVQHAESIQKG